MTKRRRSHFYRSPYPLLHPGYLGAFDNAGNFLWKREIIGVGAFETRTITLARPEVFAYWGLMSGGVYNAADLKDKMKPKLLFMSTGSFESPGPTRKAAEDLKAAGFNAAAYVSEGTRHEFQTWRRSLRDMAPMLFK